MPRYYRKRYTRVVKPKKKWATNLTPLQPTATAYQNTAYYQYVICQNANPVSIPTPVIVKTGNFKLQCDAFFTMSANSAVEFSAYIMYVPEGTQFNSYADVLGFITRHPEWIMCWKYASFDYVSGASNIDTIKISSRLKRNLNSGDSIMFLATATTDTGVTFNTQGVRGMVQYWTCAN